MKQTNIEQIKKRLSEEIENSPLTKKQIAECIGVSAEMVTQYCTTKKLPSLETFAELCNTLNVSSDYILGITENY